MRFLTALGWSIYEVFAALAFVVLLQIEPFTGAFAVSVANSINEACNNCGFTVGNLANVFPSCAGHSATFQAKIREWYSMDYPLNLLISVIQNRFNSSSVLTVPTSNFVAGSIDLPHLSFSPTNVSVHIDTGDEIGSGDAGGSGSTTDEEPIPTGDEISITTQDIGVIDSAGQTRPLFAVLVTAVAIVMGTVHFGLMH